MAAKLSQVIGSTTVGVCFCHRRPIFVTGSIISSMAMGQANTGFMPLGTRFSIARASCGHTGAVITAASTVLHNNIGVARQYDTGTGCYNFTIVTGDSNTQTVMG